MILQRLISFWAPLPPTVNHYYQVRTSRGRRDFVGTALNADAKAYRKRFPSFLPRELFEPITGHVWMAVEVYWPDNRERDLGNLEKGLLDAMTHAGAWWSDSQVKLLLWFEAGLDRTSPRVVVRLHPPGDYDRILDAIGRA